MGPSGLTERIQHIKSVLQPSGSGGPGYSWLKEKLNGLIGRDGELKKEHFKELERLTAPPNLEGSYARAISGLRKIAKDYKIELGDSPFDARVKLSREPEIAFRIESSYRLVPKTSTEQIACVLYFPHETRDVQTARGIHKRIVQASETGPSIILSLMARALRSEHASQLTTGVALVAAGKLYMRSNLKRETLENQDVEFDNFVTSIKRYLNTPDLL